MSRGQRAPSGDRWHASAAIVTTIARALLLLYPPDFRHDVGAAIVRDLREQLLNLGRERGGWAAWSRTPSIIVSLLATGVAEWRERLSAGAQEQPRRGMPRSSSARRAGALAFSPLDFKLGLRMAVRHPGLTLIGLLGMAVAIAIGVVFAAGVGIVYATLPFEDGERIVAIENWDLAIGNQDYRNLHDFLIWRETLESVEELGAYVTRRRNLIDGEGRSLSVTVAEITAAGFRLPRVPPLLGRTLVETDMDAGAPNVLVIGHDVWRSRFAADPNVAGTLVKLGETDYTVVGVMPEGFAFPLAHGLWTPLRIGSGAHAPREGPRIRVFGRLTEGETLASARAELEAIGHRLADELPATHELLRPSIIPYTAQPWDDMEGVEIPAAATLIVLLLVVIAGNVGTLVYARTAARRSELLVRTALGASRGRLVGQLFVEALVIAASAAVLGIAMAAFGIQRLNAFIDTLVMDGGAWFWMRFSLTPVTVAWALALAALGAVVAGALPAIGATGGRVQAGLQSFSGGSAHGMGRTWTTLIVAQVAFAVAVLPTTVYLAWEMTELGVSRPSFPAQEYVTGHLLLEPKSPPESIVQERQTERFKRHYADVQSELSRRLQSVLGATGVAFVTSYPGDHPVVQVEAQRPDGARSSPVGAAADSGPHAVALGGQAGFVRVEPEYFDVLEIGQLAGRRFIDVDASSGSNVVIVNRSFANDILAGGAATGLRIRYLSGYRAGGVERQPAGTSPDTWYEIVGVVEDFPAEATTPGETLARIYHPLDRGAVYPAGLVARLPRGTSNGIQRTRDVAAAVEPALRFTSLLTLEQRLGELQAVQRIAGLSLSLVTLSVALLSMAGLYALMSYAVVRRYREIGIRRALGSRDQSILRSIFGRVLGQLGVGAAVGLVLAAASNAAVGAELGDPRALWFVAGVFIALLGAGVLAAFGPARRALRIAPTDALRE